jgi:uncharacterized membrane protein
MRVEESVEINRPLEEVFNYVSDMGNYPEWMAHALEVRKDTPSAPQQSARFVVAIKSVGRRFETPYERTPYERDRRYTDRAVGGLSLTSGGTLPFRRCPVGRASREPWTLSRVACSSCWSRFRSGQPSANSGKTCRR